MHIRTSVVLMVSEITDDVCRREITNVAVRVSKVSRQKRGHVDHVIHKI